MAFQKRITNSSHLCNNIQLLIQASLEQMPGLCFFHMSPWYIQPCPRMCEKRHVGSQSEKVLHTCEMKPHKTWGFISNTHSAQITLLLYFKPGLEQYSHNRNYCLNLRVESICEI